MNNPSYLPRFCVIALLGMLILSPTLDAKVRVAVKARSSNAFLEQRELDHNQPLSYVFAQGDFFGNSTRSDRIKQVDFLEIAETLSESLAAQNFLPAQDQAAADMLLVVHWGAVEKFEDPNRDFALQQAYEGIAEMNQNLPPGASPNSSYTPPYSDMYSSDQARFDSLKYNNSLQSERMQENQIAEILGFDDDLAKERAKPFATTDEVRMLTQLQQERYLIVVMAWDFQELSKNNKKRLLWTTRISMKALGSSYKDAVLLMSKAGEAYYGNVSEGLETKVYKRDEYKIELGDLEVVESGEAVQETLPAKRAKGRN
ncbi:hypothetical protein [Pelagicoccus albus]|uniref:Uncharacterized protein n=1 Tax=Pelagicoccus albus TaxID=415222 RepID=A0A7X1EA13_9BACT|nr:hypothetical protein [Pelagicoccus albus]MBC2607999.1 hypothetical protein [Pelagicoccus albus]